MFNVIFAMTKDGGIGFEGKLPWPKIEADLRHFRQTTSDSIVIMGRKTFESLGCKTLPGRINLIVSSDKSISKFVLGNLTEALYFSSKQFPNKKIFVIGGAALINEAMVHSDCEKIYVSIIQGNFKCDTFIDLHIVDVKRQSCIVQTFFQT
jgi:dihydrofolate reductase